MTILYERPEWQSRAACRGMGPEMFFLERKPGNATGDEAAAARAICDTCTVAAECRQAGEVEVFGIWAGTSPRQRQRMRGNAQGVRIKRRVDAAVCGTVGGHDVHRRNGEPPCRHCEWAYNEWLRVRANDSQWRKGRKRGEAAA